MDDLYDDIGAEQHDSPTMQEDGSGAAGDVVDGGGGSAAAPPEPTIQPGQEDASTLAFGKEFEGVDFLSNGEVAMLLASYKERNPIGAEGEVYKRAMAYANEHGGVGSGASTRAAETLDALRDALEALELEEVSDSGAVSMSHLHPFEIASLCNLTPESVDAAKALIQSLERFADADVQSALDIISHHASRILME